MDDLYFLHPLTSPQYNFWWWGLFVPEHLCEGERGEASKDTQGTHVNVYSTWTDKVTECWRYTKRRQIDRRADRRRRKDERWQKIATKLGFFPLMHVNQSIQWLDLWATPDQVAASPFPPPPSMISLTTFKQTNTQWPVGINFNT